MSIKQLETCMICGKKFMGYANSAWPLLMKGWCCDACNMKFVIPARLERVEKEV